MAASWPAATNTLARTVRRTSCPAPGPTATVAFLSSTSAEEQEQLAALPPLGRLGRPDDIAGIVSFLVGPAGRWVNGQVVYANGGLA
jgi:3-oxoacyl-[acyl-carrier protein] reductase